jgi:hypothetical protein
MKTVLIGDIHGRDIWKKIIEKESPNRVVFIGDYLDSFDISPVEQIYNLKEILHFKKNTDIEVITLIGNHDYHYMNVGETYSGYRPQTQIHVQDIFKENIDDFKMAYSFDKYLCTHAGVSSIFMNNTFGDNWDVETIVDTLNLTFRYKPLTFKFNGWSPYGNDVTQSPIWIRPESLLYSNKKHNIKKRWIQIFGHTEEKELNLLSVKKNMGGRYYNIDTLNVGKYLIHEKKLKVGHV